MVSIPLETNRVGLQREKKDMETISVFDTRWAINHTYAPFRLGVMLKGNQ